MILSGLKKEIPLREKTATSGSKSDKEEGIVGSEISGDRQHNRMSQPGALLNITERQVTAKREHGSSETVTCHARTRRKKKDRKSE